MWVGYALKDKSSLFFVPHPSVVSSVLSSSHPEHFQFLQSHALPTSYHSIIFFPWPGKFHLPLQPSLGQLWFRFKFSLRHHVLETSPLTLQVWKVVSTSPAQHSHMYFNWLIICLTLEFKPPERLCPQDLTQDLEHSRRSINISWQIEWMSCTLDFRIYLEFSYPLLYLFI